MEQDWDALTPGQRQQAEERFRRGMGGPQGPGAEETQRRWQSMTPGQRRELMMGHRSGRGPHGPGRGAPRGGPG